MMNKNFINPRNGGRRDNKKLDEKKISLVLSKSKGLEDVKTENSSSNAKNTYGHDLNKITDYIGIPYSLGSEDWKSMYSSAALVMKQTRILPKSNDTSQRRGGQINSVASADSTAPKLDYKESLRSTSSESQRNSSKARRRIQNVIRNTYKASQPSPRRKDLHSYDAILDAVTNLARSEKIFLVNILERIQNHLESYSENTEKSSKAEQDSVSLTPSTSAKTRTGASTSRAARRPSMKYGRSIMKNSADEVTTLLRKIGIGMDTPKFRNLNYDITGRGEPDMLGPTGVRERIHRDTAVELTGKEINLLMKKFDSEGRGTINILTLYGNAQNQDIRKPKTSTNRRTGKHSTKESSSNLEEGERRNSNASQLSAAMSLSSTMTAEDIKSLQGKLGQYALHAIRDDNLSPLSTAKPRVTTREFRQILAQLEVGLSPREFSVLERRYLHGDSGLLDIPAFLSDFKAMGEDALHDVRQTEARAAFIRALSRHGSSHSETSSTTPTPSEIKQNNYFSTKSASATTTTSSASYFEGTSHTQNRSRRRGDDISLMTNIEHKEDHYSIPMKSTTISSPPPIVRSSTSTVNSTDTTPVRVIRQHHNHSSMSEGRQTLHSSPRSILTYKKQQNLGKIDISDDVLVPSHIIHTEQNIHHQSAQSTLNSSTKDLSRRRSSAFQVSEEYHRQKHHVIDDDDAFEKFVKENHLEAAHKVNHLVLEDESKSEAVTPLHLSNDDKSVALSQISTNSNKNRKRNSIVSVTPSQVSLASSSVSYGDRSLAQYAPRSVSSDSRQGLTIPKSTRGLLQEPAKQPIRFQPDEKIVIAEWKSEGLQEDIIGDLELIPSFNGEWELRNIPKGGAIRGHSDSDTGEEGDGDDEDEDDQENDEDDDDDDEDEDGGEDGNDDSYSMNEWKHQHDIEVEYRNMEQMLAREANSAEDEYKSDDNRNGMSNDDASSAASYSVGSRAPRAEEVLRLAEDVLRMSVSLGGEVERGVPVNESRDELDDNDDIDMFGEEEEDEYEDADEEDDEYQLHDVDGVPRWTGLEEVAGKDTDDGSLSIVDIDGEMRNEDEGALEYSPTELRLEIGDITHESDAKKKFKLQHEHSNNQQEDQEDEIRMKNKLSNSSLIDRSRRDDDEDPYESDDSAYM